MICQTECKGEAFLREGPVPAESKYQLDYKSMKDLSGSSRTFPPKCLELGESEKILIQITTEPQYCNVVIGFTIVVK